MTTTYTAEQEALFADYTRTTNNWGRITLFAGFVIATSVPFIVMATTGLDISFGQIITAFIAVAAVYGAFYIVEPLTYFPILGPAGMYQAFLIGNIANKLVPSAIVAQSTIDAKPGTRKAAYAATAAISGAAVVHVTSLLLLVGILGTWIVSIMPESITDVARVYILPSILGGVMVQLVATLKQPKSTAIAVGVSLLVVLLIVPNTPKIVSSFSIALCVILTVAVAWFTRSKDAEQDKAEEARIN
jgi:signal transduction histidine kinase